MKLPYGVLECSWCVIGRHLVFVQSISSKSLENAQQHYHINHSLVNIISWCFEEYISKNSSSVGSWGCSNQTSSHNWGIYERSSHHPPQLPNLLCKPSPHPNCLKVHKEEGSLNKREYLTCSRRIWDKCDYMFKMYALINYYLDIFKINTYKGAIKKEGSRACYNT